MHFGTQIRFRCPRCKHVYARSLSEVILGSGTRKCSHCHFVFADGAVEWPNTTEEQRREYLFPLKVKVAIVMESILAFALGYVGGQGLDVWSVVLFSLALILVWLLCRLAICKLEIRASIERYEKMQLAKAGYAFGRGTEAMPR